MRIEPAVIRSYQSSTHTADVQLETSLGTYLKGVPVDQGIHGSLMVVGRRCLVLFVAEGQVGDAVVAQVFAGSAPAVPSHTHSMTEISDMDREAGVPLDQVVITPYNFLAGTGTGMLAANDAILILVNVEKVKTVSRIRIGEVLTSAGQIDVGVYRADLVRLGSSGAVACPPVGPTRDVNLTASVAVGPGAFWLAIACNTTTAQFRRYADRFLAGVYRVTNAFPLPASIGSVAGFPDDKWIGLGCM